MNRPTPAHFNRSQWSIYENASNGVSNLEAPTWGHPYYNPFNESEFAVGKTILSALPIRVWLRENRRHGYRYSDMNTPEYVAYIPVYLARVIGAAFGTLPLTPALARLATQPLGLVLTQYQEWGRFETFVRALHSDCENMRANNVTITDRGLRDYNYFIFQMDGDDGPNVPPQVRAPPERRREREDQGGPIPRFHRRL